MWTVPVVMAPQYLHDPARFREAYERVLEALVAQPAIESFR